MRRRGAAGGGCAALDELDRAALDEFGLPALDGLHWAAFGGIARRVLMAVGEVGATACLVSALIDVTEMRYIGPPSWGLCLSHVVLNLFPWRPTG